MRKRNGRRIARNSLAVAAAMALIAFPEPITTVVGVALLGFCGAMPAFAGQHSYRPAPCSGTVIRRGLLPA
ncbi:MAG: hypothetical protein QUS33_02260 [Dehalococcoidia bacterium]|nr:hypothetical protein [Dehalococcoidia bacterium]